MATDNLINLLHEKLLSQKDKEIKRLIKENLQLQSLLFNKNEKFYQKALEIYFDCGHFKYNTGITDLTGTDFHGEIKVWISWKVVIGQLMTANLHVKKNRLCAYFFGQYTEKSKKRATEDLKKMNIEVYDLQHDENDNDNIIMTNLITNDITVIKIGEYPTSIAPIEDIMISSTSAAGASTSTGVGTDAGTGAGADASTSTGAGAGADASTSTGAGAGADSSNGAGADASTSNGAGAGTDSGASTSTEEETEYNCQRCGYGTNIITNIRNHFLRKNPCTDKNICGKTPDDLMKELNPDKSDYKFVCDVCGTRYISRQALFSHKQRKTNCKISDGSASTSSVKTPDVVINYITINNFGSEKYDHVINNNALMKECFTNLQNGGFIKIIEEVYYNKFHPENRNVYLKSKKSNTYNIYKDNVWKTAHTDIVIPIMIRKGYEIVDNYMWSNAELRNNVYNTPIHDYLTDHMQQTPVFKKTFKMIKIMTENNR
jgi:predicted RNA-binding Zn-ribbon protein involved in translation (DUF1610 family)